MAKGQTVARFLYSGSEIIAEYNGAGALQTRYVRGASADEVLVEYQGGAPLTNKRWLIADERGSIIGAANSSGASQWKNAYDGEAEEQMIRWIICPPNGRPSPANQGRFQFTGQLWLFELNLYHYKARLYSPTLGRFLQTDPIGYSGGLNLYAYVGGDPVNRVDPSGNCGTPVSTALGAFAGALLGTAAGIAAEFAGAAAEGRNVSIGNVQTNAVAGLVGGAVGGAVVGATCNPATGAGIGIGVAAVVAGPIGGAIAAGFFNRLFPAPQPKQRTRSQQRGTVSITDVSTYDPFFGFSPGIQLGLSPSPTQVATVTLGDVPTPDPDVRGTNRARGDSGGRGRGADVFTFFAASGAGPSRSPEPIVTVEDND